MKRPSLSGQGNFLLEVVFLLSALVVSFFFGQLRLRICEHFVTPEMFADMANHMGNKPWQYRILVPEMANALSRLKLPVEISLFGWARWIELGFMFLTVIAFRRYLDLFLKDRRVSAIMAFMIFLVLPFHVFFPRPYFANYWFDTPALLFLTLGLTFLYQKKWTLYYGLFVVATLNRETTCFLTMIYLFTTLGRERLPRIAGHCAAQFVIWMSIKVVLGRVFAGNPGVDGFEWMDGSGVPHWLDNLRFFAKPSNVPAFLSMMGFLWIPVLCYYKRIDDVFVRRALWVIPVFFSGMFFVANIYELRIFAELIPVVLTPFLLILVGLIKGSRPPAEDPG